MCVGSVLRLWSSVSPLLGSPSHHHRVGAPGSRLLALAGECIGVLDIVQEAGWYESGILLRD